MISVYKSNETDFTHNGIPITTLTDPIVTEVANGMYEVEFEAHIKFNQVLEELNILKINTPNGKQLFRIYKKIPNLDYILIYAKHIFYDLEKEFLEDIRPTDMTTSQALNEVLSRTRFSHRFKGSSDHDRVATAYFIRKNPVSCILGSENSICNRWGGYLIRDNFNIKIAKEGNDNNYSIMFGKNLIGIEEEIDTSDVITSLYPTYTVNNAVKSLPEKYIDSPLIKNYPFVITKEFRVNVPDKLIKEEMTDSDYEIINEYVREQAKFQFEVNNVDKPVVNYSIDFVELSKTTEYQGMKFLQKLSIQDVVYVKVPKLDLELETNVISYKYNANLQRFENIELGNPRKSTADTDITLNEVLDTIKDPEFFDGVNFALKEATEKITGNRGGYIVTRLNENKEPYEILVMDSKNIDNAKNVIRINNQGVGFSSNGYNGPFSTAITIDGGIVADFITSGTMNANLIRAGSIQGGNVTWNLDTGYLNIGNTLIHNPNGTVDLGDDIIGSSQIKDNAVGYNEIASNAIATTHIKDAAIGNAQIKNGAIDSAKIGYAAITSAKIENGAITNAKVGTLDADVINLRGVSLENFMNQKIDTNGFTVDKYGNFELDKNNISIGSSSRYVTIKDHGTRGQIDVNGTIAARGSGYVSELNSGGLYLSNGYNNSKVQVNSDGLIELPDGVMVRGKGIYIDGVKLADYIRSVVG